MMKAVRPETQTKSAPRRLPWARLRPALADWYRSSARDLPWRRTSDPYAIAVSEFMLQQTQVVTVIPYFERWLKLFPDWRALAAAEEGSVIKAWEGLGYYRRARNLQALARAVVAEGGMPRDGEELLAQPGIGPYTAAAIGSIAFGLPLAVLDGNVMRVLARLLACRDDIAQPATRARLQAVADEFLDRADPGTHNQAVMELGATVCVPRQPLCLLCPLKRDCRGRTRAGEFPVKTRAETIRRAETVAVIGRAGKIYAEQVPAGRPWHGLWRFPDFDEARMIAEPRELHRLRYGITKYAVTMSVVAARWRPRQAKPPGRYLTPEEMEALPLAAPHRKLARWLAAQDS
jgi:A/G-specific adenine glycosylase